MPDEPDIATGEVTRKTPDMLRTTGQLFEIVGTADDDGFLCRECGFEGKAKLAKVANRLTPGDLATAGSAREEICPKCFTAKFEMYH